MTSGTRGAPFAADASAGEGLVYAQQQYPSIHPPQNIPNHATMESMMLA